MAHVLYEPEQDGYLGLFGDTGSRKFTQSLQTHLKDWHGRLPGVPSQIGLLLLLDLLPGISRSLGSSRSTLFELCSIRGFNGDKVAYRQTLSVPNASDREELALSMIAQGFAETLLPTDLRSGLDSRQNET